MVFGQFTGLLIGLGFSLQIYKCVRIDFGVTRFAAVVTPRREFKRPGVYLLIGMFVLCTIPPIVWNAQHAWITLAHLRSRGSLDRGFGFHPAEVLSVSRSTLYRLFAVAVSGVDLGCDRKLHDQSAGQSTSSDVALACRCSAFTCLLLLNKSAAPN